MAPGNRAHRGAPPGALLHRRIQEQVAGQRECADEAAQQIHSQPQFDETRHGERDAEHQRAARDQAARRQWTPRRTAHLQICRALIPLIERRRAGSDQSGAEDGVQQQQPVDLAPGVRRQAEVIPDPRAHEDQPGDPRLRQFDIVAHHAVTIPPCTRNASGPASMASATDAPTASDPTATCATVNNTITGMGCGASA